MNFSFEELLEAQKRFGTTKENLLCREDFDKIFENVVIAPWWGVEIFNNYDLEITKINEIVFNLKGDNIEFSFIQVRQMGAPTIVEEVLSLGVTKCKNLIFIGSAGSISKDIHIGDLIIPKLSICGDGASRYLNKNLEDDFGNKIKPHANLTKTLLNCSKAVVSNKNIKIHQVENFSVDTIFGQFPHIDKIKSMGAKTIEMETYSFFKAAKIAGIKSTAIFCISDNTVINKSLYSGRTEEDHNQRRIIKKEIIPKILIECIKSMTKTKY